jgi:F-type H+-transporting ATPase subunit gamma
MLRNSLLTVNSFAAAAPQQQRNFATLKDISVRLKSVKNIQKITKSMKMVSAAKFAKAERELKGARSYGEGAQAFYKNLEVQDESKKDGASKRLLILITSDRGLCGAIHTSIAKV